LTSTWSFEAESNQIERGKRVDSMESKARKEPRTNHIVAALEIVVESIEKLAFLPHAVGQHFIRHFAREF
jgi:hypothetical protein